MNYREIHNLDQLEHELNLTVEEKSYWSDKNHLDLPLRLNSYWIDRFSRDINDPLRKQAIPTDAENIVLDYEVLDPIGDQDHSPLPKMVHRYKDRILLLVTRQCALYCRHCFRRHFTGQDNEEISLKEWQDILSYIKSHPEIHEVILSGGDSLMLSFSKMKIILNDLTRLRESRDLVIRIGTRVPVTAPYRLSDKWLRLFSAIPHCFFMVQVNHVREISLEASEIFGEIRKAGHSILCQSVLLRGVNDSLRDLKELSYRLLDEGIKPYYLFQGDLAAGTSHFRVPIKKSMELIEQLRSEVSGLAMPQLAVDLPGGGKIPLQENRVLEEDKDHIIFKNLQGKAFAYPKE